MKTHKRKTKVESSSNEESDSSSSSSSSSSSDTSKESQKQTVIRNKRKKVLEFNPKAKDNSTHHSSRNFIKDLDKESSRKTHQENPSKHRTVYPETESHNINRESKDRREKYQAIEPVRTRHGNFADRREARNDRERGDVTKYKDNEHEATRYESSTNRRELRNDRERGEVGKYKDSEHERFRHESFANRRETRNDREREPEGTRYESFADRRRSKNDRERGESNQYKDNDPERTRHESFADRRESRNDREKAESDKYRRHKHYEQPGNYNRNNYQGDNYEERHGRNYESHGRNDDSHGRNNESHGRNDESHHNQRYRDRNNKDYDNQRDGNRYKNKRGRSRSRSRSFDHLNAKWGRGDEDNVKKEKGKPVNKEKPNFGLSGKLTEERNTYKGVVIKYSEPPEARKPKRRWRLYPFKGEKALQTLYIHRDSAYLIGRERKVVDLPVDHPSCSKQHAALQYRLVPFTRDDGSTGKKVRPYLIDLDSANGTYINNKKMDPKKYVELLERDVIKFGFSSREYVLLHENSKDEAQDDDVKQEEEEAKVKDETEG